MQQAVLGYMAVKYKRGAFVENMQRSLSKYIQMKSKANCNCSSYNNDQCIAVAIVSLMQSGN